MKKRITVQEFIKTLYKDCDGNTSFDTDLSDWYIIEGMDQVHLSTQITICCDEIRMVPYIDRQQDCTIEIYKDTEKIATIFIDDMVDYNVFYNRSTLFIEKGE